VQSLAQRLEKGGVLTCGGVCLPAQPFLAALLHSLSPKRPLIVVTDSLKAQESFQQDIETWMGAGSAGAGAMPAPDPALPRAQPSPLYYPAWEILPHEGRLPHADTISERLETLVTLSGQPAAGNRSSILVVTSVVALLQRTFTPEFLRGHTRRLQRGDRSDPLDLVEWLEEQGYEPESQVTQKGEIALRGGILDVYPLPSPWPVRLEFFGDELESLRYFDPLTQKSREEVSAVTLPPAGELGLLKRACAAEHESPHPQTLATLPDHLPRESLFVLCEPERLAEHAEEYAGQVPQGDPFFITWADFLGLLDRRGMTRLEITEAGGEEGSDGDATI
jgi:hypothetical protein